jgi:DNA-binding transcriptional ArsR family regulator
MPLADTLQAIAEILDEMAQTVRALAADSAAAPPGASDAPPPITPRVLPTKSQPTGRGRDGLAPRTQLVLEALRAGDEAGPGGWVAAGPLAARTDMTRAALKKHLQQLGERGLVETRGETSARRYRASSADSGGGGSSPVVTARQSPERAPAPPPTEPADEPQSPPPPPAATGTAGRVVRSRILDHVSRRRLSEQSLVGTLNLEAGVVAEVCGRLLAEGKIVLLPNGTYEHADGIG